MSEFLHPKYIPTWLVLGLMRLVVFIPFKWQWKIARALSYIIKPLMSSKTRIVKINLQKCFPQLNQKKRDELAEKHFQSVTMSLFEVANCFYMSPKRLQKMTKVNNKQILQQSLNDKKNVIILIGHFTTMVFAGRILAEHFHFADIYRPQNNKLFDHVMIQQFTQYGIDMIKVKDSKKIIKTLKSGVPIWYAPDQDLRSSGSVFAPFFNIPTNTITGTAKLAKISKADVISYDFERNEHGYTVGFKKLDNFPMGDVLQDATRVNQIIESKINKAPEQYLWTHRRFKRRPEGEASFYE